MEEAHLKMPPLYITDACIREFKFKISKFHGEKNTKQEKPQIIKYK